MRSDTMNEKNIFKSNRVAWNQALEYHQKARNNSLKWQIIPKQKC